MYEHVEDQQGLASYGAKYHIHTLPSGETTPGVLHPALESSAQDRYGPVEASPEEGHVNDQRNETPLVMVLN